MTTIFTHEEVLNDSATFSPRRWKTGWPHHLGHVPPFKDDAFASLTRRDVFYFAEDAHTSGFDRGATLDFIGAAFAFGAGKSPQTQLKLQQFLRNKSQANNLLRALRNLEGLSPTQQFAAVHATGLNSEFSSVLSYFLAGPQSTGEDKPVIITHALTAAVGVDNVEDYEGYLFALAAQRDRLDPSAALDQVEASLRNSSEKA